ncbi:LysR family transcriptional regulator [Malikia spinosa]|uniref:LysR family transcriptional regulator n=1 Tax=Malikia spinosa TaxID=86180 RepID=A0A7C9NVH5_9BURK|nr:LysR family transcriptional regulator [Malikia spinosa]MYZ50844.1 LysR family transcriptional regulator [Malikia spinosa]
MSSDRLFQIEFFVQVAELGSLTKAAEKLEMSNAAASRTLLALEERLGARLVERTTRRLWLTEVGQIFYRRCSAMLSEIAEAEAEVNEATLQPTGTLHVTSSVSFSMLHIAPALPEFQRRYPLLKVQITAANRYFDFIEAGIDVAIRTREYESDSNITVRKLSRTWRVMAASPGYLAANGVPKHPDDLKSHRMLIYNLAKDPTVLHLSRGDERRDVEICSAVDSNEGQVIVSTGLAGLGILIQPLYIIHDEIVAGRLVPVLLDWELPPLTINIAYQSRRHLPAKIRVFTDYLVERFEKLDLERKWAALRG